MRRALTFLILAACASGCRGSRSGAAAPVAPTPTPGSAAAEPPKPAAPAELPVQAAAGKARATTPVTPAAQAANPPQASALTGRLLERIVASPYCYLRLQTSNGEVWAAVPDAKLDLGAEVVVEDPVLMGNFESKTLKRTFPGIYFGVLAGTGTPAASPHGASHPGPHGNPHQSPHGKPAAPVAVGKVARAAGPDARTVAEVWSQKDQLEGRTVSLHGRVVKYNAGVMGKNWIHLQDGSGNAGKGTHDLTLTTMDQAAPGEIVTARGVVRTRKDFGSGYAYEVIVEDVTVERK